LELVFVFDKSLAVRRGNSAGADQTDTHDAVHSLAMLINLSQKTRIRQKWPQRTQRTQRVALVFFAFSAFFAF